MVESSAMCQLSHTTFVLVREEKSLWNNSVSRLNAVNLILDIVYFIGLRLFWIHIYAGKMLLKWTVLFKL